MTFIPLIGDIPPLRIHVTDVGAYADIPLAIDSTRSRSVFVRVALEETFLSNVRFFEFKYVIGVVSRDGSFEDLLTQDRDIAARYIPPPIRALVMPIVCRACAGLIEALAPAATYRVTKGIRLPPRALAKHDMITNLLVQVGYVVHETGTDAFGRTFWYHVRVE